MPGIWTPQPDGTFQPAKGVWVSDPAGEFQTAKGVWITKSDGSFANAWPLGVALGPFSAQSASPSYSAVKLTWSGTAVDHYELRLLGSSSVLYSGPLTTFTVTGLLPNTTYNFTLRAYAANGSYSDSEPVSWTTSALPAPTGFAKIAGDYHSSLWQWNPVTGATGYDLLDTLHSNTVLASTSALQLQETGLVARSNYERAIRAKISSAYSPPSNKVNYTTPAPPSAAPGTYAFGCVSAQTWAPGLNSWRPVTDGIYAGNGAKWGDTRGKQVALAFYGSMPWLATLQGARCTRFKVSFRRDNATGISSPQPISWWLHKLYSRPAGAPTLFTGPVVAGSLAKNQSAAIDLPVSWGQAMLEGQYAGIALGNVDTSFLRADPVASVAGQLTLYFTVG